MKELSVTKIAYFAGLLDGEGCVRIGKYKNSGGDLRYRAFVQIAMTVEAPIDWLVQNIGGGKYIDWKLKSPNSKITYCWTINCKEITPILKVSLPYLLVKKEQALDVITFSETLHEKGGKGSNKPISPKLLEIRRKIFERNKLLNHKGR